jgi:hypothetical protein
MSAPIETSKLQIDPSKRQIDQLDQVEEDILTYTISDEALERESGHIMACGTTLFTNPLSHNPTCTSSCC